MADPGTTGTGTGGGTTPLWQEWMQEVLKDGNLKPNEDITEQLKEKLMGTWDDLKKRLDTGELGEIAGICSVAGELVNGRVMKDADVSLKTLCKAMVQVRYFTSALKKGRSRSEVNVEGDIKPHEWYPRCLVGMVALSEIYGDHCDLKGVVEKLGNTVDEKLEGRLKRGANSSYPDKCKSITSQDILLGKAILGNAIKTWVQDDRRKAEEYDNARKAARASGEKDPPNSSIGKMGGVVYDSESLCKGGGDRKSARTADEKKQQLKENTKSMAKLFGMNVDTTQSGAGGSAGGNPSNPFDALIDDKLTLQQEFIENVLKDAFDASSGQVDTNKINDVVKNITNASQQVQAENCIHQKKDNGKDPKPLCDRLRCMKYLWTQTDPPSGQAGGTTTTKDFWEEKVRALWKELSDEMVQANGTEAGIEDCEEVSNGNNGSGKRDATHSEKTACNYLHAGFQELYKAPDASAAPAPPAPSSPLGDILSTKHPSFRQTMGCFLLHSYAKHMKSKAICNIDKGISKAFDLWENPSTKAPDNCNGAKGKTCIPCKWEESQFGDCQIDKIGQLNGEKENVEEKLKEIVKDDGKNTNIKTMTEAVNTMPLCDQVKCVTSRWWKEKKPTNGTINWNDVWEEAESQLKELSGVIENNKKDSSVMQQCMYLDGKNGGEACLLIAAGLKSLYDIQDSTTGNPNDAVEASFKRTMQCVVLNAMADKLESSDLPCRDEKKVANGITVAFNKSGEIMSQGKGCKNGNNTCFECKRYEDNFKNCTVNNNVVVKTKVQEILDTEYNNTTPKSTTPLSKSSLIKTICKPCEDKDFCERLECIREKYGQIRGWRGATWSSMEDDFTRQLTNLLTHMREKQNDVAGYCNGNGSAAWANDAHGKANETACKLVAAGLQHISSIQHTYKSNGSRETDKNGNPYDNQDVQQFASCLMLKAIVQKMKEESKFCDITKGINEALKSADAIKRDKCKNEPCIVCNLDDYDKLKDCPTGNNANDKVKDKLDSLLGTKQTTVNDTLKDLLKADQKDAPLCSRLQCLASRVQALNGGTTNADDFWKKDGGEVQKLWTELSTAMKGKENDTGNGCGSFATDAEKTACNYLHAGFKKLYEPDSSSGTTNNGILSTKHPSFRQTMGCFLLHYYAEHMKSKAICNIEKGITQAFNAWQDPSTIGKCNNGSCVPCQWADNAQLNTCIITTTDTNGRSTSAEKVEEKLKKVLEYDSDSNIEEMLTKINKRTSLCDHMKCIATHLNSTDGQKNADEFWTGADGEVHKLWKELADAMNDKGKSKNGDCARMGDNGNDREATDPEKKACQYLTLGFNKLKQNSTNGGTNYPILSKDPSLRQTLGCFLLKEYAKKMKDTSTCVIDSGIQKAFKAFNESNNTSCTNNGSCIKCEWNENDYEGCTVENTTNGRTEKTPVKDKLSAVQDNIDGTATTTLNDINKMDKLCDYIKCAAPKWFYNQKNNNTPGTNGTATKTWCDFWDTTVKTTLQTMFDKIEKEGKTKPNPACTAFGDENPQSVERKACNHITAGLKYIKDIPPSGSGGNGKDNQLLHQAVGCIALNMYADQIRDQSKDKCPIDEKKIGEMFDKWNQQNNNKSSPPCNGGGNNNNVCFKCTRQPKFNDCKLSVDSNLVNAQSGNCSDNGNNRKEVQPQMNELLKENNTPQVNTTLTTITNMKSSFCTQLQCAAKKWKSAQNRNGPIGTLSWSDINKAAEDELTKLLGHMLQSKNQNAVTKYCKDYNWDTLGHKQSKTNKAACLLFASGLKHIYEQRKVSVKGPIKGPSFEQTMGCLFLKEYAKQLKEMAKVKKEGNSWVHPLCSIEDGINYASMKSENIMDDTSPCKNNGPNSCFVCTLDEDYKDCSIGNESVKDNVGTIFQDDQKQNQMQETLENTVCPILLTDLLTPFLPLAPVSIGLSAMAYYLWKYFGPLGKGGTRFRRSPADIPGPSVQEQVLDHVEEAGPHEYQLMKERKPHSAPTRTKRSGRTIIEIHFEVLDECQKGDTQLNQKDFLELLVREFMGSELMEEEQVPKEEVLMEGVPMEGIPLESVPSLGSVFMV
ncbi:SICAvar, type I [Plasmodium knowlesi strain H]|uniref:SICAvar, type I n=3 Tax=Plasmodium knowlesi TaxID=5850 RepID=A0A679L5V2_PLAKH|nr:SICAvar, type I [Plasmodium knowlesi strain H]OTN65315.1 SICAvar type I [Plasmodium knowlesi]CAA9989329.1 SICAvar, type I [Plasmodium knowlesi strain H]SBO24891.1 SICAvar, type I [Plasmodium knowlesi strain H]VVS78803.1 SICAvar, type I [Plasmodium knowlesi strain H]